MNGLAWPLSLSVPQFLYLDYGMGLDRMHICSVGQKEGAEEWIDLEPFWTVPNAVGIPVEQEMKAFP